MYQCFITVGICWLCGWIGARSGPDSFFKQFPQVTFDPAIAKKLLPLSVIFVGMITFNNLCLKYVEVSFYNVARSLTIVFNVVLTYITLGEKTTFKTLSCLGLVIMGFFVGSGGEVNFSIIGTAFGVISSLFVSLNAIQTKKVMPVVDGNQWTLSAYNNINATLMFIPIILLSPERKVLLDSWEILTSPMYWFLMTVGGVFGFLIGIVTIMQIKLTSPLTHNISGTAKSCVQTVLALMIWRNETNFWNMLGVFLVLFGSAAYSYIRNTEMASASAAKAKQVAGATPSEGASSGSSETSKASGEAAAPSGAASAAGSSGGVVMDVEDDADESETAPLRK
jgi:GDP-fucose transporter C1